jgi:opacity protein-like surface antigen
MNRRFHFQWKFRSSHRIQLRLVEALALTLFLIGTHAFASTGSSWSGGSNWGEESNASMKHLKSRGLANTVEISPFSPGSHNVGLDLGQVFLMGGLTQFNDSLGFKLHYNYGVSDLFSFDSSLGYSSHSEGKYSMTSLLTGIRVNLSWYDKIIPYCSLGLGFYKPSFKDITSTTGTGASSPDISAVLFGLYVGPGIDLEVSKSMFFGASLTFHNMFGTTKTFANGAPVGLGGSFTSFFLRIGTTF